MLNNKIQQKILAYFLSGDSLSHSKARSTPLGRCQDLTTMVKKLRRRGYKITTISENYGGKEFFKYQILGTDLRAGMELHQKEVESGRKSLILTIAEREREAKELQKVLDGNKLSTNAVIIISMAKARGASTKTISKLISKLKY